MQQTATRFARPAVVDDLTIAFPARVVGTLLPREDEIPAEFKRWRHPWAEVVSTWFYLGLDSSVLVAKPGIDKAAALRHLKACLGSFEPSHENKTFGVAYLMSLWFEPLPSMVGTSQSPPQAGGGHQPAA